MAKIVSKKNRNKLGCYHKINSGIVLGLIFFILTNVPIFAQNRLDQTIDFSVEEETVNDALLQLSEVAEMDIAFSKNFFSSNEKVSINVENATVKEVLLQVLKDCKIDYKVLGDRIVLFRKKIKKYTISGYIEDKEAGERLIAATVYCPQQQKGIVTNEYGFYSLTLEEGEEVQLQFSYLGFQARLEEVKLKKNVEINVELDASLTLEEVIIEPEDDKSILIQGSQNQAMPLNKAFVEAVPSLGGTADPIRAAQNLPGIQGGTDGLGGLQVRGGDPGQNLMLLDGVPVYIPYHLLGVYSIYNPSAINSAKVFKSSFSARYGGRLSSIIDVRTREGNKYNWQGEVNGNLINMGGVIEGPIKKEKGSILLAGRFSPSGFLLEPVFKRTYFQDREGTLQSNFYDINAKANYQLSQKDRVYLSFFQGSDLFQNESEFEDEEEFGESELFFSWDNTIAAFRWNHLFNDRLFLNTTLTYSNYKFDYSNLEEFESKEEFESEVYFVNNRSNNRDYGLKLDFDYLLSTKHKIRFGLGGADREFIPDFTYFDFEDIELEEFDEFTIDDLDDLVESETYSATEGYVYFEDQIKLNEKLEVHLGLRGSVFLTEDKNYLKTEPRLSIQYQLNPKVGFYASGSRMIQYLHLIPNSALRLPNDLWIPSSESLLPQEAWQSSVGMNFLPKTKLNWSIEAYYKQMKNIYINPDNIDFLEELEDFEPFEYLISGSGKTYGLETMLQFSGEQNGLMLSYTLSKNERQFEMQNEGKPYPHNYDQRHQTKCFFYQKLGTHFQISANYIFNSPNPQFNIVGVQSGQGLVNIDINEDGNKNGKRSEPYHRLDLELSYQLTLTNFEHNLKVGAYNAYNRQNIAYYEVYLLDDEESFESEPVFSIPILPALSYSLKF